MCNAFSVISLSPDPGSVTGDSSLTHVAVGETVTLTCILEHTGPMFHALVLKKTTGEGLGECGRMSVNGTCSEGNCGNARYNVVTCDHDNHQGILSLQLSDIREDDLVTWSCDYLSSPVWRDDIILHHLCNYI